MALYYQDELLTQNLHTLLGDIDPAAIELLRQRMEWVEIAAGETLMAQGGVVAIRDSVLVRLAKSEFTSLYFNPPLERVGMLQWEKFGTIVEQGHAHGVAVLSALGAAELKSFAPFPFNHPHILGQRT